MNRKIVLATDLTDPTSEAVRYLKSNYDKGDEIVLLHIIPEDDFDYFPATDEQIAEDLQFKKQKLEELAQELLCRTIVEVIGGDVTKGINHCTEEHLADLLVIGYHKHNFIDRLFNRDIGRELLDNPPCPIVCC